MNIDNLLRTLNQYMDDIFETFGGQSKEYMNALKQVKEALPESVLDDVVRQGLDYSGDAPEEPLKFSRSKSSRSELEEFSEDLRQLRAEQRESGTARKQAKKYIEDAEARGIDPNEIDIKEEAQHKYDFDNSTNDWYEDVMNDEDIPDDWKEEIRDKYSTLHEDYEDANFRDELEIMIKIAKRRAKAARKHRGNEAAAETDLPSGVGYKIDDDFGGTGI